MSKTKEAGQPPRFTRSAEAGIAEVRATYTERGGQYGDTLEHSEWLALRAHAKEFAGVELTKEQARILGLAALADVKHERFRGGWKLDNLVDGGAYGAVLIGETLAYKGGAK